MKDSKLVIMLRTFSEEEIKLFGKFTESPFFNSVKNCMKLLHELEKFYPDFDSPKLTSEYIFRKIYKGKLFNKQVIWNLSSALEKLAKEFLMHTALMKENFESSKMLLSELSERKLMNEYRNTLSVVEKQMEGRVLDYDFFDKKTHIQNYKQEYYHMNDDIQPMGESKLKASEYQVILFLRMTAGGLNDMKVLTTNYNTKFETNIPLEFAKNINFENIIEYAGNKNYEYSFLIEIYYHAIKTILSSGETPHFDKLRKLYETHYNKFSLSEKRTIMHWLVNHCLDCSQIDMNKYKRIIFELNEFRLKEGLAFYPKGQIPGSVYFQMLNTALEIKEINWAENFIENYSSMLNAEIRDSQISIAYAILYFETKNYDRVFENLNKIEFDNIWDKLKSRILFAKTYYETGQIETLLSYIDSSLHFISSNPSIFETFKKSYRNFFNYLRKITYFIDDRDLISISVLKNELRQLKSIENKQWLIKKLDDLENTSQDK